VGFVKLNREKCRKAEYFTIPCSNDSQDGWLVSSSTDLPTKKAKSLIPLLGINRQRDSKVEVKEGLVELDRNR
jgi:hypothetical protein